MDEACSSALRVVAEYMERIIDQEDQDQRDQNWNDQKQGVAVFVTHLCLTSAGASLPPQRCAALTVPTRKVVVDTSISALGNKLDTATGCESRQPSLREESGV